MHCMDDFPCCDLSGMPYYRVRETRNKCLQASANYIVSQFVVWTVEFPGGIDNGNVKWRALIWAISEVLLLISVSVNYLPPRFYSTAFRLSIVIMMLDFFLCVIWLPIGVSKTYGFRSAKEVFTTTCNAPTVYILFLPCL